MLRRWLDDHGGPAKVILDRRLPRSQESYLSQLLNGYSFGSRAARNMESRLGMPLRYLEGSSSSGEPLAAREPMPILRPTLTQALEVLGLALARDMPAEQREDIADALAKLARRQGSARDQGLVLTLIEAPSEKRQVAA